MKTDKFLKELEMIGNEDIRIFVSTAIENLPDYFFEVAASSTGKFHPDYALGDGGLVRHTCAAVRFANHLLCLEQFQKGFTDRERDIVISAILLHDGWKHGDKNSKFTVFEHPQIAADWIRNQTVLDNLIPDTDRELIASGIESHMGEWTTNKKSKIVLPNPKTKIQKFVHMCDYLASRKDIEVIFENYEKPELPSLDEYVLAFGKHTGKKLMDVAKTDPSYIVWAKENVGREPLRSLLKQL